MASLVTAALGLVVAAWIVALVRNDRLHASHGLGWTVVAIGFALLGFAPAVVDNIATYFGVAYPPVLALMLCVSVIVIKILRMDIEHSRLETRNQRLVQRVAMLEERLNKSVSDKADASEIGAGRQDNTKI